MRTVTYQAEPCQRRATGAGPDNSQERGPRTTGSCRAGRGCKSNSKSNSIYVHVCPAALEHPWANQLFIALDAWVSWQYTPHPQPWPWFSLLQTALLVDYFQMPSRKAHRIDSPPWGLSKSIQYSVGLPEGSHTYVLVRATHTHKICSKMWKYVLFIWHNCWKSNDVSK